MVTKMVLKNYICQKYTIHFLNNKREINFINVSSRRVRGPKGGWSRHFSGELKLGGKSFQDFQYNTWTPDCCLREYYRKSWLCNIYINSCFEDMYFAMNYCSESIDMGPCIGGSCILHELLLGEYLTWIPLCGISYMTLAWGNFLHELLLGEYLNRPLSQRTYMKTFLGEILH